MNRAALAALVALSACTSSQPARAPSPEPAPSPTASPATPATSLPVVAAGSPGAVDGIRLAAEEAGIALEVIDPGGDPAGAIREAVASGPPAVLVVEEPAGVVAARPEIEAARVPVVLVGGDLYSSRSMFRYVFQTSVPLRWEARVLAHYLVADRRYDEVAVAGDAERGVFVDALTEEGVSPAPPGDADAVLGTRPGPADGARLALSGQALGLRDELPAGTVACAPYTWAGWAEPIPRVARFRDRFASRFGREPGGLEQEGYDAVHALVTAAARTDGSSGDELVRELESLVDETFSSTPIRLGPDDHVFAEQSHLGLFEVASPVEPAPGEDLDPVPWRPVMRTFTTNGKRVNLADRDVRVFFPSWGPRRPRPNYWRSRYGIVTRPDDPLA